MKDELMKALKQAMIEKDEIKKNTITLLRAAILQEEKDNQIKLDDNQIQVIVAKEIKKRKESIDEFKKVNRQDAVNQAEREIEILSKYLPKQLSMQEVEQIIDQAISQTNASSIRDMSKVMKQIKDKVAGKADGKMVSDIVKQKLMNK